MEFLSNISSLPALAYVPFVILTSYAILYYLVYWRRTAQWRKSNIPFLPPSFLIGHKYFWSMTNNSFLVPIDRIYKENKDKDVIGFFMATMPAVLIRNPAVIKEIFAKNFDKTFETGWAAHNDKTLQHMPSLSTEKEQWKRSRMTLSPTFTTARVSGEAFTKITRQIGSMLAHLEQAHLHKRPISAKQVSLNFISDSTSNSIFGLEANSYEKKGDLLQLVESFMAPSLTRLLSAFAQMHFQGLQAFESFQFVTQKHKDSMKSLISKQLIQRTQTEKNENDLIDLLIGLKENDKDSKSDFGVDISKDMIGVALSRLWGGDDGAPLLASFTIHLLSLHPQHQDRIRQEVEEVMKSHNTTEFTYEVVRDLHFLEQCLHETARLFPNMPALTRMCLEDFEVTGTDYTFKKGERVIIDPYSVHRDPKFYKNPEEFDPDRFSPENKGKISPDTYLAFGYGPRKCPGFKVGFLKISTMIGSLLHKYELKPRSHKKQIAATDFHPRSFLNIHKDEILVDIVPRPVAVC